MNRKATHLGAHGRIVLPAAIREAYRLKQGDELIVVADEDGILLLTPEQAVRRAQAIVREHVSRGRSLSRELLRDRRRESRGG